MKRQFIQESDENSGRSANIYYNEEEIKAAKKKMAIIEDQISTIKNNINKIENLAQLSF